MGQPRYLLRVVYREPEAVRRFTADRPRRLARGWTARFAEFGRMPVNPWLSWLFGPLAWTILRRRCLTVTYTRTGLRWPPRLMLVPREHAEGAPETQAGDDGGTGKDAPAEGALGWRAGYYSSGTWMRSSTRPRRSSRASMNRS